MKNKPDKITETIFDHNMTKEEHQLMCNSVSLEEYLESIDSIPEAILSDICSLYDIRGNKETALKYLEQYLQQTGISREKYYSEFVQ